VDAAELRQRATALEGDLWPDHSEDRRAAELLAAFADYDPDVAQTALMGEAGSGSAGRDLLGRAGDSRFRDTEPALAPRLAVRRTASQVRRDGRAIVIGRDSGSGNRLAGDVAVERT
jgi:hypothetical protein